MQKTAHKKSLGVTRSFISHPVASGRSRRGPWAAWSGIRARSDGSMNCAALAEPGGTGGLQASRAGAGAGEAELEVVVVVVVVVEA